MYPISEACLDFQNDYILNISNQNAVQYSGGSSNNPSPKDGMIPQFWTLFISFQFFSFLFISFQFSMILFGPLHFY